MRTQAQAHCLLLEINPVACRHKRLVLQCLSISNKATAGTVCICDDVPGCTFSHSTSNSSYSLWPWQKTLFVQLFCFYHSDALFGQRPRTLLCRFALIAENSNRSCFLTAIFVPVLLCQFESSSSSKKKYNNNNNVMMKI